MKGMPFGDSSPDSKIRALEAHVEASVQGLLDDRESGESESDGLLLLGSWQEAMPALVHLDPVLDAIDIRVFAVLWLWGKRNGKGSAAFPDYPYLLEKCRINSRATLARAIAMLRITRWISRRVVRDRKGRVKGSVYALHDEPFPLAGTLRLDPDYMAFLRTSAEGHHHDRVRTVAREMLASLDEDITTGEAITEETLLSQTGRRLSAITAATEKDTGRRYFCFSANALARLNGQGNRVQKLNSVVEKDRVQFLNSGSSSNCYYKKTTTTTTGTANGNPANSAAPESKNLHSALIYPGRLSENERELAERVIATVSHDVRQPILDELEGQLCTRKSSANPIRNPVGYLSWLCNQVKAGHMPLTSESTRVHERRQRQRLLTAHDEQQKQALTQQALSEQLRPTSLEGAP